MYNSNGWRYVLPQWSCLEQQGHCLGIWPVTVSGVFCGSKSCQVPLKHDTKMIFIAPNIQYCSSLFEGTEETDHYSPFCYQFKGLHAKQHVFSVFLYMYVYVFIFYICEC